jgi:hypothetical protein
MKKAMRKKGGEKGVLGGAREHVAHTSTPKMRM